MLFKPIKPHFFKIILDDAIHNEKLVIPRKFVRKYGQDLSDSVVLKIPGGANWQVTLTKSDDEVWLSKGWLEFAANCYLEPGHFLVFEYEMNSCFTVVIFDTSATEIDYPCGSTNATDKSNLEGEYKVGEMEETDNDETVETLDVCNSCGVKRDRSQLPCEQPHKRRKANLACQDESISKLHKSVSSDNSSRSCKTSVRTKQLTHKEREEALQRANEGFKSENPSFTTVVHSEYIYACQVNIPFEFAEKYLQESNGQVILQVKEGGSWVVGFYVLYNVRKASFSSGWRVFARESDLKLGDVTIFELIDDTKLIFNIIISRATEDVECHVPLGLNTGNGASVVKSRKNSLSKHERVDLNTESSKFVTGDDKSWSCKVKDRSLMLDGKEKKDALQRAKAGFRSENPSFMVVMQPKYIRDYHVQVPFGFFKKYLQQNHARVILQVKGGRPWIIGLYILLHQRKASFCTNWRAFVGDNNLKLGDVAIFELIEDRKLVFNVIISRTKEDVKYDVPIGPNTRNRASVDKSIGSSSSKSKQLRKNASANMQFVERHSGSNTRRHVEAAEGLSSRFPSFTVVNGSWNLKRSSVHLPCKFTRNHVKKSQGVELQVADKLWPAEITVYQEVKAILWRGWCAFARDNDLKVGDACVYELIQNDPMVFNVSISRPVD